VVRVTWAISTLWTLKISPQSKSPVYRWYPQLARGRFVYDTYKTVEATRSRHGWVHMFITHRSTVTLQLYNFDFFRTRRTSSFCTVAWQFARIQLTRRIARSIGDCWASCYVAMLHVVSLVWLWTYCWLRNRLGKLLFYCLTAHQRIYPVHKWN